jgi:hypothetical protein
VEGGSLIASVPEITKYWKRTDVSGRVASFQSISSEDLGCSKSLDIAAKDLDSAPESNELSSAVPQLNEHAEFFYEGVCCRASGRAVL